MSKERIRVAFSLPRPRLGWLARLLPAPGTVVFTVLVITGLFWAQSAGALPLAAPNAASTGTIAYQGRLADTAGAPLTGTYNMTFRLYSAASGGAPLWEEPWNGANSVQVSDGLFNVMLGSLASIPQNIVAANSSLFLGITVGTDSEMTPRVQLGSVPFAVQALTVPDGSITMAKLSSDISLVPPDGSITTAKIADGAVTQTKAPTLIRGMIADAAVQWGALGIAIPNATDTVIADVDFVPNFTSRPMVMLQPTFGYTPRVIVTWGAPCDGDKCRVWITRTDGGSWAAGQSQGLDWIAIGK